MYTYNFIFVHSERVVPLHGHEPVDLQEPRVRDRPGHAAGAGRAQRGWQVHAAQTAVWRREYCDSFIKTLFYRCECFRFM